MATFRNPMNGYTETVEPIGPFFWTLLFGPFYFAIKGAWPHVFIWLLLAVLFAAAGPGALLLLCFGYAFAASGIIRKTYLRRGWAEVSAKTPANATPPPLPTSFR